MRRIIFLSFFIASVLSSYSQKYCAFTSYSWDSWVRNHWDYAYKDGWVYAVPYFNGNPRDFYYRFNYSELGLHELDRHQWKLVKANDGWLKNLECTFEYYVTDKFPTLKDALVAHSWPCAKYYHNSSSGMPIVKRTVKAKLNAYYKDRNDIMTLNFWIDGYGFAITVNWHYSGYNMKYIY